MKNNKDIQKDSKHNKLSFASVQKLLKQNEKDLRIEFVSLTKKEKDVLMKTVKLQEEIGELSNDILSTLSLQRKSKLQRFDKRNLYGEFADVLLSTLVLATALGVNVERAIHDKLKTILQVYSKDK